MFHKNNTITEEEWQKRNELKREMRDLNKNIFDLLSDIIINTDFAYWKSVLPKGVFSSLFKVLTKDTSELKRLEVLQTLQKELLSENGCQYGISSLQNKIPDVTEENLESFSLQNFLNNIKQLEQPDNTCIMPSVNLKSWCKYYSEQFNKFKKWEEDRNNKGFNLGKHVLSINSNIKIKEKNNEEDDSSSDLKL